MSVFIGTQKLSCQVEMKWNLVFFVVILEINTPVKLAIIDFVLYRSLEGLGCQDHYDWYSDWSAMVHLRHCQGCPQTPATSSPADARKSAQETGSQTGLSEQE